MDGIARDRIRRGEAVEWNAIDDCQSRSFYRLRTDRQWQAWREEDARSN
jgi:hypothetical protein